MEKDTFQRINDLIHREMLMELGLSKRPSKDELIRALCLHRLGILRTKTVETVAKLPETMSATPQRVHSRIWEKEIDRLWSELMEAGRLHLGMDEAYFAQNAQEHLSDPNFHFYFYDLVLVPILDSMGDTSGMTGFEQKFHAIASQRMYSALALEPDATYEELVCRLLTFREGAD